MVKRLTILIMLFLPGVSLIAVSLGIQKSEYARFTCSAKAGNISDGSGRIRQSVKENSLTEAGLVLLATNRTAGEMTCGPDRTIEQKRDGIWYAMDGEQIFNDIAIILPPESIQELSVTWEKPLPRGEYRIIKSFWGSGREHRPAALFFIP